MPNHRKPRRYAWSTGVQFPSRLLDNVTGLVLKDTAPKELTQAFNRALRAYTR